MSAAPPPVSETTSILRQHWRPALLLLLAVLVPLALFADIAEDILGHGGFAWDRTMLA